MKEYLFEKEIRLFGIKRSGNAAIVSFILGHYKPNEMVYLHNTDFSFRPRDIDLGPCDFHGMLEARRMDKVKCYLNTTEHNYPASSHLQVIQEKMRDRNHCYNMDRKWYSLYYGFGKDGFSEKVYNIFLIRSPHNNLASILRILQLKRGFQKHIFYNFAEDWLMYAREALGETEYFWKKIIVCNFDEWFSSEDYRRSISDQLGLEYSDKGVNDVIRTVGSSFDGMRLAKEAQKMRVLDRWEYFKDDNDYLDKLRNDELIEKTKLLFDVDLREILDV